MEFDFEQFQLLTREPFLRTSHHNSQLFKTCEKNNTAKIFTLIMMDGNLADQLKTHLQCQSITKSVIKVKGFKQMDSTDSFGFKVERTGWLVEDIATTLEQLCLDSKLQCLFSKQQLSESPSSEKLSIRSQQSQQSVLPHHIVMKLLSEVSLALCELQQEEIALTSLTLQSIIVTTSQSFKLLDMSGAMNTMGMKASLTRQIQGIPHYFDPETHRASLEGEVFLSQNYFKQSVYALGLIMLEVCTLRILDRRLTVQEVQETIEMVERQQGPNLARVLNDMLAPQRADRPDCIQLQKIIEGYLIPPMLMMDKDELVTLAFTNSLIGTNNELLHPNNVDLQAPRQILQFNESNGYNSSAIQFTNSVVLACINPKLHHLEVLIPQTFLVDFKITTSEVRSEYDHTNNGVHLPETLRHQIKLYQMGRQQSRQDQGQGTSRDDFANEQSSDYIEEISYSPITITQLMQQLQPGSEPHLPRIDMKQLKIDRNRMLGRGTEGIVYLCSIGHCQNLAVKVLQDIDNQWVVDLLHTTNSVQNRKVKGIFSYDYYAIEPSRSNDISCNLYMISRRMRCDLGFANKELKLVEGSKLFICTQIAHVLVEIEGRIIHGDLKPSNILLDGDNNINVIGIDCNEALDFGMSRILSKAHNHLVESNSHTYLYSPPEQVLQKSAHAKSDIWSFGIIMFELFTNRQMSQDIIYEMGMYDENRKGNLHIKLSPKDALHKGIYELIELMTNFNYEERPSARDIWAKLHHMQQHYHAPPSPTVQAIPIHNKQKPPPVKKSDSKQNLLMVQGKQIKYQAPPEPKMMYQAQTHINKKESPPRQQFPTQITKK